MKKKLLSLALSAVVLSLSACASAPKKPLSGAIFFPAPPELPRLQYLTSFTGLKDVEEQSSFNKFVVGEKQNRRLNKPYGVGIFGGKIYVCDTNDTVIVFDLTARTYGPLKGATGDGQMMQPLNISIEKDGTKYVADPVRGQIVVFNQNDDYVRAYGTPGNWKPVDAVPYENRLYVADIKNGLVKVFDKASGEQLKSIGNEGEPAQRLDLPTNLAFDQAGYLYVTDVGRFQVVKFDRDGHFRAAIGSPGDNLGSFARPKGIALDREGHLYAVDAAFNNVQVFNKDGRLLLFWGQNGGKPGDLTLPAKIAIDYDNLQYFKKYLQPGFLPDYLVLVTSQFGDHSVSVLAYGKEKGKKYPTDEGLLKQVEERRKKELEKQKQQPQQQEPEKQQQQ